LVPVPQFLKQDDNRVQCILLPSETKKATEEFIKKSDGKY
jgi:hypothetical protein